VLENKLHRKVFGTKKDEMSNLEYYVKINLVLYTGR